MRISSALLVQVASFTGPREGGRAMEKTGTTAFVRKASFLKNVLYLLYIHYISIILCYIYISIIYLLYIYYIYIISILYMHLYIYIISILYMHLYIYIYMCVYSVYIYTLADFGTSPRLGRAGITQALVVACPLEQADMEFHISIPKMTFLFLLLSTKNSQSSTDQQGSSQRPVAEVHLMRSASLEDQLQLPCRRS